jgi:hypothetical protein
MSLLAFASGFTPGHLVAPSARGICSQTQTRKLPTASGGSSRRKTSSGGGAGGQQRRRRRSAAPARIDPILDDNDLDMTSIKTLYVWFFVSAAIERPCLYWSTRFFQLAPSGYTSFSPFTNIACPVQSNLGLYRAV